MSFSKKIIDVATIGLFLGALCLPFLDESFGEQTEQAGEVEFRTLARAPLLPSRVPPFSQRGRSYLTSSVGREWLFSQAGVRWMTRYPGRYQAYHSDNFGWREELLRAHSALSWSLLGVSPNPIALRGQANWIFTDANHELAAWRGALPFSTAELSAWARCLRARREFFAQRGIDYVLFIAPDKASVYPEFMPDWARQGESRLQQLTDYLGDEDVGLFTLLEPIVGEKARDRTEDFVYRRLGSHWTERGAKVAAEAIADELRKRWPTLPEYPIEEYQLVEAELDLPDDMGLRLRVSDAVLGVRHEYDLVSARPSTVRVVESKDRNVKTRNTLPGLPSAWIQHDSFGRELQPFLAEYLGDSEFYWGYEPDLELLLAKQPDILIEVIVERALNFMPPSIPRTGDDEELAARFDEATEVLLSLPAVEPWHVVRPNDRTRLAVEGSGLSVEGVRLGPAIYLPPFACPSERDIVLRIELDVEVADQIRVVYSTRSFPEFEPRTSLAQPLKAGRNVVHFELLAPELEGPIFLMPFNSGRNCLLRAVEARAVAR